MEYFLLGFASFLLLFFTSPSSSLNSDGLSLLALKEAISNDPTHILQTWSESDSTPCNWFGITCLNDRVTEIYLNNRGFNGYIPSELGALVSLRRLSLFHNNFTKPIPSRIFSFSSLIYLDLSRNSLTGPLPEQIKTLKTLVHLDLSSNLLNGSLPESLSELPELTGTLNLSYNRFSGQVPASFGKFPVIVSLDLRHNNLTGKIPQIGSLLNQGPTAFSGNPNLCGFPLQTPCPDSENPKISVNPVNPKNPSPSFPTEANPEQREKTRGSAVAVPIISGVSFIVGVISVSVWLFRKKWRSVEGKTGKENFDKEEEEGQKGKFAVLDEGFGLELEDLLRASAYVVGKSRSGIVYKVVVGRGSGATAAVVAVRRLSEGGGVWRLKEFESEVEAIGRVHHPNIVRLRAYYYANDEKLLVSDFISNGSLYSALHEAQYRLSPGPVLAFSVIFSTLGYIFCTCGISFKNTSANSSKMCAEYYDYVVLSLSNLYPELLCGPSNSLPPLSWTARLKIAQGAARGLMYIHECSPRKYIHGNIKSSKILLDDDLQPYISGFGLTRLVSSNCKSDSTSKKQSSAHTIVASSIGPKISVTQLAIYMAPEARIPSSRLTQKCDVYSFGIVLLELLTGQLPDAGLENDGKGLESFVRKVFHEERPLSEIIDSALLNEIYAKKQVLAAFHIALNCTEIDPEMRPRMRAVSESLDHVKSH
ncbi:hypothetical protein HHK36_011965 [Tetracentron sinense]|uniref:Protein kinase domain-containing protein n=1 Tax=Tetracentron sinense TaxID=13715 RepID=A0A834ZAJ6_TETSI|nr:hypothetical protein HHK36_011965 [Tetracentron sinense]